MRLDIKTYNTLPTTKSHWWQMVVLPTLSVMNNIQKRDPYVAFNFEWLFWSFTTILSYGKKRTFFTR